MSTENTTSHQTLIYLRYYLNSFRTKVLCPLFLSYMQGIVSSGFLLPLLQWVGRVYFMVAIVRGIDEVCLFFLIVDTKLEPR